MGFWYCFHFLIVVGTLCAEGSASGFKLKVLSSSFVCLFVFLSLSLCMHDHFLIFPIDACSSHGRKVKKQKNEAEEKGASSLNFPEVISARVRGACNSWGRYSKMVACLFAPLWSEAAITIITDISRIWRPVSFCPPWFPQALCKMLQELIHSCLSCVWRMN